MQGMYKTVLMKDLQVGQAGTVHGIYLSGSMRRRMQDIGLIKGTRVECVGRSPLKDPAAFLIKGAVIAVRNGESEKITVSVEEKEG